MVDQDKSGKDSAKKPVELTEEELKKVSGGGLVGGPTVGSQKPVTGSKPLGSVK